MQFSKGAGLKELLSFNELEERDGYKIYRPFYNTSRSQILSYLNKKGVKYYIDESNTDIKFKRNLIRHEFSDKFINMFENGVKKSFEYLQNDLSLLFEKDWNQNGKLYSFKKTNPQIDIKNGL